ncbi:uncharacterized protein J3D65DRAFT_634887 [Phyllosticta citribraziliensis]|uniref:Uncharacterized protein n=1 Tax=Phyllosticta citribraziliensis TaxID=989973 RepID=A0ABR1LDD6_9PEZI
MIHPTPGTPRPTTQKSVDTGARHDIATCICALAGRQQRYRHSIRRPSTSIHGMGIAVGRRKKWAKASRPARAVHRVWWCCAIFFTFRYLPLLGRTCCAVVRLPSSTTPRLVSSLASRGSASNLESARRALCQESLADKKATVSLHGSPVHPATPASSTMRWMSGGDPPSAQRNGSLNLSADHGCLPDASTRAASARQKSQVVSVAWRGHMPWSPVAGWPGTP